MSPEQLEKYLDIVCRKLDALILIVQQLQKRVNDHINENELKPQ